MMRASNTSLTCFGLSVVALAACSGFMLWPAVAANVDENAAETVVGRPVERTPPFP